MAGTAQCTVSMRRQVGHWRPNTNTSHTAAAANTQRITLMSVGMVLLLDKSGYGQVGFPKEHSPFQVMHL